MINILAYSAGRSDLDRWQPFIMSLISNKSIYLKFILGDAHFDKNFGLTYKIFKKNYNNFKIRKFKKSESLIKHLINDTVEFEKLLKVKKYDFIILLGDRYEILNLAYLSTIKKIPIIHIYGGAITTGAIDNQIRNAVSKLSHYHLVACSLYKKRLIDMGESKNKIKIIGVPNLKQLTLNKNKYSKNDIESKIGFKISYPTAIITIHPVTLYENESMRILKSIFKLVKEFNINTIFTYPNNDPGSAEIIKSINKFYIDNKKICIIKKNFENDLFASLLNKIDLMIGNSSSGIVESPSFKLPTINIGNRQNGKLIPKNVICCQSNYQAIKKSIIKCLDINFKRKLSNFKNPYESNDNLNLSKIINNLMNNKSLIIK